MTTHYVLINEAGVYVKEVNFFKEQGGLTNEWGRKWEPIDAKNLHDARRVGIELRRSRFPTSHRTIGEDENMNTAWPEAIGQ